jgi:non-ribosomal peptide synthase protein (TIGR01720 family)
VRYLPDGAIEFIGRRDSQVKVRGFRIELGEIEAGLASHPAVREVVVLAREDTPGDKRLVAYVVSSEAPTAEELKEHLASRLPHYMVPAAFVTLEKLPLTPNGKVDRKALPAPEFTGAAEYVAPRTPTEEMLAAIWAEVLKVERVGVNDNFFELGGDSILSFQVISKAKRAGLQLRPKQIFEYQRLAELAAVAEKAADPVSDQGLVTGDVPLTPIQHWFFEQNFIDPHHWNQAVWLELRQELDPSLLVQAIQHLIVHHDALRMRFRRSGTGWKQFNAGADETHWLTRVDLSSLNEAEKISAVQKAAAELQGQLNLEEGPLLRAGWFDFGGSQPTRFLIAIHHLVVDTVSWRILSEDLQTACRQLRLGNAVRLPDKTTSFRRWAQRLTEYACSAAIERQMDHWLSVSEAGTGRLPLDFSDGENTGASARTVSVSLDVDETRTLIRQVPQAYATQINDVLLCALAMALGRWSGQSTACIHLEGHGREELFEGVDLSRSVGWFTTLFPVRLDLGGSHEVGDRLKTIKEQLRRIPQRGIGFGLLRYSSGNEEIAARLRAQPQPEVVFNYLGQYDHDQTLSVDAVFTEVNEPTGPVQNLRARRSGLLTIIGLVANGRLQLGWTYSENVHRRTTIENLAGNFMEALRELIRHCTSQVTEPALSLAKDNVHNGEFGNLQKRKKKIELNDAIKMLGLD